jgi:NCAIR mutase (PurE)-related protein
MDAERLRKLLEQVREGKVPPEAALELLRSLPYSDLGYAHVDHHRALRLGMAEVILAEGKTADQIAGIARELIAHEQNVLITRLSPDNATKVLEQAPELTYEEIARVATFEHEPVAMQPGAPVAVVTAGTSDIPVAEEAIATLRMSGIAVARIFDVGVAGLHRVVGHLETLRAAPAVIVVAGMEGALPSVVGGMLGSPIVAVPTSIGYGASLGGFTALFGMLSGCASGVTVVNIDNGFGAAMAVARIISRRSRLGGGE